MRIRTRHLLTGALAVLLTLATAPTLVAQEDAASISEMIRLDVAPDQEEAFEEGMTAYMEDARAQGVEGSALVWQVVTGKHSGDYYVGLVDRTWAEFGESTADDPEALQQSLEENVVPHVKAYHTTFWEHAPELSYSPSEDGDGPAPLMTVTFFKVEDGSALTDAAREIARTAEEADFQENGWAFHQLEYGGGSVWALVSGRDGWGDLAEPETTLWDALSEEKSEHEMDALEKQLDKAIESSRSEIFHYQEDLSYLPEGEGEQ